MKLSRTILQGNKDRVEIKSQASLNGQAFRIFKSFIEQFETEEQATIVKQRNIGGETLIWDNEDFATWGTNKWGDSATTSFVLGNPEAGVLGSSKLGSQTSKYEITRIIPPNRKFKERFLGNQFISSGSTCTIDNSDGYAQFSSGEVLYSTTVYKNNETIDSVRMNLNISSGSSYLSSFISSDGGSNYQNITNSLGETVEIVNTGKDVRYKIKSRGSAKINSVEVNV